MGYENRRTLMVFEFPQEHSHPFPRLTPQLVCCYADDHSINPARGASFINVFDPLDNREYWVNEVTETLPAPRAEARTHAAGALLLKVIIAKGHSTALAHTLLGAMQSVGTASFSKHEGILVMKDEEAMAAPAPFDSIVYVRLTLTRPSTLALVGQIETLIAEVRSLLPSGHSIETDTAHN